MVYRWAGISNYERQTFTASPTPFFGFKSFNILDLNFQPIIQITIFTICSWYNGDKSAYTIDFIIMIIIIIIIIIIKSMVYAVHAIYFFFMFYTHELKICCICSEQPKTNKTRTILYWDGSEIKGYHFLVIITFLCNHFTAITRLKIFYK